MRGRPNIPLIHLSLSILTPERAEKREPPQNTARITLAKEIFNTSYPKKHVSFIPEYIIRKSVMRNNLQRSKRK